MRVASRPNCHTCHTRTGVNSRARAGRRVAGATPRAARAQNGHVPLTPAPGGKVPASVTSLTSHRSGRCASIDPMDAPLARVGDPRGATSPGRRPRRAGRARRVPGGARDVVAARTNPARARRPRGRRSGRRDLAAGLPRGLREPSRLLRGGRAASRTPASSGTARGARRSRSDADGALPSGAELVAHPGGRGGRDADRRVRMAQRRRRSMSPFPRVRPTTGPTPSPPPPTRASSPPTPRRYHPAYVFLGNENDYYFEQDPRDYANWILAYDAAYDADPRRHRPRPSSARCSNTSTSRGSAHLAAMTQNWGALAAHDLAARRRRRDIALPLLLLRHP